MKNFFTIIGPHLGKKIKNDSNRSYSFYMNKTPSTKFKFTDIDEETISTILQ